MGARLELAVICPQGQEVFPIRKELEKSPSTIKAYTDLAGVLDKHCERNCAQVCEARVNLEKLRADILEEMANSVLGPIGDVDTVDTK
jgi:hypothetical protein